MFVSPRAFSKQSELAIGWVVAAFFLAVAPPVEAKLFGVNGFSGNPGINGGKNCNHCHSDGVEPTVLLDGPAVSNVSETHTYLLRIDGGQESICGLNVSATGGTLSALASEPETRTRNDEIVNFTPKLVDGEGGCTYAFDWTAPSHGGVFRLFGSGNSANRDGQLTGDRAASTGIEVVVTGAPPVNQTPVAFSTGPYRVLVGETTPFDATPSLDWDGFIRSYAWAFGTGMRATVQCRLIPIRPRESTMSNSRSRTTRAPLIRMPPRSRSSQSDCPHVRSESRADFAGPPI